MNKPAYPEIYLDSMRIKIKYLFRLAARNCANVYEAIRRYMGCEYRSYMDIGNPLYLNADSDQDDVSKELKAFLDYVAGKRSEDDYVKRLKEAVEQARKNREWRHEYMTLLMRDQENMEKGMEKGKIEGRAEEIIESGFEFGLSEKDILTRL